MTDFTKEIAATLAASRLQAPGGAVARGSQVVKGPSKGPRVGVGIDLSQDKEKFSLETSLKMAEVWRNLPQAVKEQGIGNPLLQEHLQKVQKLHPYLVADASIPGVLTPEGDARWSGKLAFATRPKSAQEMLEKKEMDKIRADQKTFLERSTEAGIKSVEAGTAGTEAGTAAQIQETKERKATADTREKSLEEQLELLTKQILALKQGTKFEAALQPGKISAQAKDLELTDADIKLKTAQAKWYDDRLDIELAKVRAGKKSQTSPYKGLFSERSKADKLLRDQYKYTLEAQPLEFAIQSAQDTLYMLQGMGETGIKIDIEGTDIPLALPATVGEPEALMWASKALNEIYDVFRMTEDKKDTDPAKLQELHKLATALYVKAYQPLRNPMVLEHLPDLSRIYIDPDMVDKLSYIQYIIEGQFLKDNPLDPNDKEAMQWRKDVLKKRKLQLYGDKDNPGLIEVFPSLAPKQPSWGLSIFNKFFGDKETDASRRQDYKESLDPYSALREED